MCIKIFHYAFNNFIRDFFWLNNSTAVLKCAEVFLTKKICRHHELTTLLLQKHFTAMMMLQFATCIRIKMYTCIFLCIYDDEECIYNQGKLEQMCCTRDLCKLHSINI